MCTRQFIRKDFVLSLKTMCIDLLIKNIKLYQEALLYLPENIKNRILKRLDTLPFKFNNIDLLYKCLLHQQVEQINFSRIENLNDNFLQLISTCKNLRSLTLTRNNSHLFSPEALINILPNFKMLVTFIAPNCCGITDEVTKELVKNCKYITGIDFSGCLNITDVSIQEISKLKYLTALKISKTKVSTEGVIQLSRGSASRRLKELYMDQCNDVTNDAIHSICEHCTAIEVLIFNNCSKIDGQSCINMENNTWKNLKQLTWTVYW